jgi:hypothetical protein
MVEPRNAGFGRRVAFEIASADKLDFLTISEITLPDTAVYRYRRKQETMSIAGTIIRAPRKHEHQSSDDECND